MKDERQTGIRRECFAAGAGGEPDAGKIERHRADRTDRIEAELRAFHAADAAGRADVVQYAGRRFARGHPEPVVIARLERAEVERLAPVEAEVLEIAPCPDRGIAGPLADLARAE